MLFVVVIVRCGCLLFGCYSFVACRLFILGLVVACCVLFVFVLWCSSFIICCSLFDVV